MIEEKSMIKCRLCSKETSQIVKSHILPEALISRKSRSGLQTIDAKNSKVINSQTLPFGKGILCYPCEHELSSKYDKYFIEEFLRKRKINFKIFKIGNKYALEAVNISRLKLQRFVIWCVLRSYFTMQKKIEVGKLAKSEKDFQISEVHLQVFKDFLMEKIDKIPGNRYSTIVVIDSMSFSPEMMPIYMGNGNYLTTYPVGFRVKGHHAVTFSIGPFVFYQFQTSHDLDKELAMSEINIGLGKDNAPFLVLASVEEVLSSFKGLSEFKKPMK